jgi:hypothetical protein
LLMNKLIRQMGASILILDVAITVSSAKLLIVVFRQKTVILECTRSQSCRL